MIRRLSPDSNPIHVEELGQTDEETLVRAMAPKLPMYIWAASIAKNDPSRPGAARGRMVTFSCHEDRKGSDS